MDLHLRNRAERLVELAESDIDRAFAEASAMAAEPGTTAAVRSIALRAAGTAARRQGRIDQAKELFDRSIEAGVEAGDRQAEGRARICRAGLASLVGRFDEATVDLDAAQVMLSGVDLVRVAMQRASAVHESGDLGTAAELYDRAVDAARSHGLTDGEARMLSNRGVLAIHRGNFEDAERDLRRAEELYRRLGKPGQRRVEHNLGYLAACQGRLPQALSRFDAATRAAALTGSDPTLISVDRADALLAAGLTGDAERESLSVGQRFRQRGSSNRAANAYIVAGQAALSGGSPDRAIEHLQTALREDPGRRPGWRAVATALLVDAMLETSRLTGRDAEPARARVGAELDAAIATLDAQRMIHYGAEARLTAMRMALANGDRATAEALGEAVADLLDRLPASTAADYWLATAGLRRQRGDDPGAMAALNRALAHNHRFRQSLPWVETATSVGPLGSRIADLGLRLAIGGGGEPAAVLRWLEARYRTAPVGLLSEPSPRLIRAGLEVRVAARNLRDTVDQAADEASAQTAGPPAEHIANLDRLGAALVAAERRLSEIQRAEEAASVEVLDEAVASDDGTDPDPGHGGGIGAAIESLGQRDLLMIGLIDDELVAVSRAAEAIAVHRLASLPALNADIAILRAAVRQAWRTGRPPLRLSEALARIDAAIVPAEIAASSAPLVVVVGPELGSLAFGMLPSLATRSITIAPSLAHVGRATTAEVPGSAVFVAGPDLPSAEEECRTAARFYPAGLALTADRAEVDAVLASLHHSVVHLACHGVVRHDNPLFSALGLVDGPLPLHALRTAPGLPATMVLSACDVGRPAGRGPGHVLGLPSALLSLGVRSVVASPIAVPDGPTATVMVEFHRLLAAGIDPATALARIRDPASFADDERGPLLRLVGSVFSHHGGGSPTGPALPPPTGSAPAARSRSR